MRRDDEIEGRDENSYMWRRRIKPTFLSVENSVESSSNSVNILSTPPRSNVIASTSSTAGLSTSGGPTWRRARGVSISSCDVSEVSKYE